jgi:hypothetical protein
MEEIEIKEYIDVSSEVTTDGTLYCTSYDIITKFISKIKEYERQHKCIYSYNADKIKKVELKPDAIYYTFNDSPIYSSTDYIENINIIEDVFELKDKEFVVLYTMTKKSLSWYELFYTRHDYFYNKDKDFVFLVQRQGDKIIRHNVNVEEMRSKITDEQYRIVTDTNSNFLKFYAIALYLKVFYNY